MHTGHWAGMAGICHMGEGVQRGRQDGASSAPQHLSIPCESEGLGGRGRGGARILKGVSVNPRQSRGRGSQRSDCWAEGGRYVGRRRWGGRGPTSRVGQTGLQRSHHQGQECSEHLGPPQYHQAPGWEQEAVLQGDAGAGSGRLSALTTSSPQHRRRMHGAAWHALPWHHSPVLYSTDRKHPHPSIHLAAAKGLPPHTEEPSHPAPHTSRPLQPAPGSTPSTHLADDEVLQQAHQVKVRDLVNQQPALTHQALLHIMPRPLHTRTGLGTGGAGWRAGCTRLFSRPSQPQLTAPPHGYGGERDEASCLTPPPQTPNPALPCPALALPTPTHQDVRQGHSSIARVPLPQHPTRSAKPKPTHPRPISIDAAMPSRCCRSVARALLTCLPHTISSHTHAHPPTGQRKCSPRCWPRWPAMQRQRSQDPPPRGQTTPSSQVGARGRAG